MVKKELSEKQKKEIAYGIKVQVAGKKNDYIKNLLNGRYFLTRYNMMAQQLLEGDIKESIDGCKKSEEFLKCEAALMKMQAIMSLRNAHFNKQDMLNNKNWNLTEKDILEMESDYYNGKIIRDSYDETYKKQHKAEFVEGKEEK